jgi:LSD1 subclass zinc finger protein
MNCPSCGAPLHLQEGRESLTCDYCQSVYLPEENADGIRVFEQPAELACPVCQVPLAHAAIAHRRILYCTRCRGTLIPMPVFVLLVQDLRARWRGAAEIAPPPEPRELDRHLSCPQCAGRMDTHYYAGGGNVVIDDCSRCELNWLDAGELSSIGRAPGRAMEEPGIPGLDD